MAKLFGVVAIALVISGLIRFKRTHKRYFYEPAVTLAVIAIYLFRIAVLRVGSEARIPTAKILAINAYSTDVAADSLRIREINLSRIKHLLYAAQEFGLDTT